MTNRLERRYPLEILGQQLAAGLFSYTVFPRDLIHHRMAEAASGGAHEWLPGAPPPVGVRKSTRKSAALSGDAFGRGAGPT